MTFPNLSIGLSGQSGATVDVARTAKALGSGSEDVFASPAMIALMEAAAVAAVERHLPQGQISLGTHLDVEHIAATAIGAQVTARAELTGVDGRLLRFALSAHEGAKLIGRGTHTRAVVDRARFLDKLNAGG